MTSTAESPDIITVDVPTHWYNLAAELDEPIPPHLHPGTKEPVGPDDLVALFPMGLIAQEVANEAYIEIPEPVREIYKMWRPSPLLRARKFEESLNTKARIYVKYEGVSPVGSHKTNSAVAQAYYNHVDGVTKLTTETGAGQWGSALAFAGAQFGIDVEVWQVRASYDSKPYRGYLMRTYGATVHPSPSTLTESGRAMLEKDPNTTGSLGMAVSEAVEVAANDPAARYALGSVLNHVVLHQSVIGLEAVEQLYSVEPGGADIVFGCAGGGSNLGGLSFPFIREKIHGRSNPRVVAAEPAACPSITEGEYRYDHGDVAGLTPLLKMHTLGMDFVPDPIHAGGLRYHGMAPALSHTVEQGLVSGVAITQHDAFAAGVQFARAQGIVPAPESTHAIAACAAAVADSDVEQVVVIGLSGHGQLDLPAYAEFLDGKF
ncbi:MAG TPA: TrpB-like pyridoxal phosphate-dependent enzyme [Gordonia sp. (in: high G+C Gram-positive bacteria)]|uniref:TrpB-like pyridoxal phosphate-dependent enzyme n=1 Tax=unclassified Gordonia (in: high G+C Gram-positive bacteria) TaxID=2657482 RepID=UPI000FC09F1E|nr:MULTISPECIES: TrpB-like pyridoxal phosphate-dependent enzyme [unclassified Gordonia (in: high G+C Gram-positive bacteria)]RUP36026.1 MAG: TrpB-like pyridoxal phosphate-dependent enzyme [Gordonia sp. (in: high G+C Gram-positive bacteria)]HNP57943.1 TrpB-like pyridoxal phosphate-dependent enzyme [Gordonia sp. (in: high G+C Gram-positive bacteria)]HRC49340.1 TrpB-like pyridoxal phosphate-dependent enzyme [Gordonia sp. (in: high G+C Gram-positive bacteria)]